MLLAENKRVNKSAPLANTVRHGGSKPGPP